MGGPHEREGDESERPQAAGNGKPESRQGSEEDMGAAMRTTGAMRTAATDPRVRPPRLSRAQPRRTASNPLRARRVRGGAGVHLRVLRRESR